MVKPEISWHNIFLFFLIVTVGSLPLSPFLTSVGIIGSAVSWLFAGSLKRKKAGLIRSNDVWLFLGIYFLHIAGLLYTSDFTYAFHDLKVKLPLLVLPVIFVTAGPLTFTERRIILIFFTAAVVTSSIISASILLIPGRLNGEDVRQMAPFISHIRLALMVDLSIFTAFSFGLTAQRRWERYLLFGAGIWLVIFLFLLKSFTGLILFLVCLFVLIPVYQHKIPSFFWRRAIVVISIVVPVISLIYLVVSVRRYYSFDETNPHQVAVFTVGGRAYRHDFRARDVENGHFVWQNVCEDELRIAWPLRSRIPYDSLDRRGNPIRFTLIRYLTSKGLPKDSLSVMRLADDEISSIENGVANYLYRNKLALYPYVYRVLWELDSYARGNNPSGHSVAQRIIYWKAALQIIRENIWFGVGTGDVQHAFNAYYERNEVNLQRKFWLRAHNQYLTFMVTFGIPGFLIIMAGLLLPFFRKIKYISFLAAVFLIISFLSMIPEDTLETQAGATFFAFFYSFFILANRE